VLVEERWLAQSAHLSKFADLTEEPLMESFELDRLSFNASFLLTLLWEAFVKRNEEAPVDGCTDQQLHLVVLDDYVPQLSWIPVSNEDSMVPTPSNEELPSSQQPLMLGQSRSLDSRDSQKKINKRVSSALNTSYRQSPFKYCSLDEHSSLDSADAEVNPFSWLSIKGSSQSKSGSGSGSLHGAGPSLSGKGAAGHFMSAILAQPSTPTKAAAAEVEVGRPCVSRSHAHEFAGALILLGFPRVSILQNDLLSVLPSTADGTSAPTEGGIEADSADHIDWQYKQLEQSFVSSLLKRSPVDALVTHLWQHSPRAGEETRMFRQSPSHSVIEVCPPSQYIHECLFTVFVFRLLEADSADVPSSPREVSLSSNRSVRSLLEDCGLSTSLFAQSKGSHTIDADVIYSPHPRETDSLDGDYLLVAEAHQSETANSRLEESVDQQMTDLFAQLRALASATLRSAGLEFLLTDTLHLCTCEGEGCRGIVSFLSLYDKKDALVQQSQVRFILQSIQRYQRDSEDFKSKLDRVFTLIESVKLLDGAREGALAARQRMATTAEKAQQAAYALLQSRALTKYARSKVRGIFSSSEKTGGET
jgi:hypothetical protein